MVFGVPPPLSVIIILVNQQPLLAAGSRPTGADQHEATGQLLAVEIEVQLPAFDGPGRVVSSRRLPGPPVPHDDVATAVFALRDDPLEVEVLDGMVLDVYRQLPGFGVPRRSSRHRPA